MAITGYKLLAVMVALSPCFSATQAGLLNTPLLFKNIESTKPGKTTQPAIAFESQEMAPGQKRMYTNLNPTIIEKKSSQIDARSFTVTEGIEVPNQFKCGGHVGGSIGGKAIIVGGTNWNDDKTVKYWLRSAAVFDNDKWIAGPALPKPLGYAIYGSDYTGLYVAGGTSDGKISSRSVYRINSVSSKKVWQVLPQLPEAISYGSGAMSNGRFYVAGGMNDSIKSNRMWVMDTRTRVKQKWTRCKPVPGAPRILSLMIASGKYVYLLGGLANDHPLTVLHDAYRYDTTNDTWQKLPDLPLEGYAWSGQLVDHEHCIIAGRAYGKIDTGIWLLRLSDMVMEKIGETVCPQTTAPLIKINDKEWWLVGGEPDANKNRTGRVSVISLK